MQEHNLTPSEYSQGDFKLYFALSLAQMMRKMCARGSSGGVTPERAQEDSVPADIPGAAAFNGHVPIKAAVRLQCNECKGAQTTLTCQKCGVYVCNPSSGRHCMTEGVAAIAKGVPKHKRSNEDIWSSCWQGRPGLHDGNCLAREGLLCRGSAPSGLGLHRRGCCSSAPERYR
jgi:hypothetical protein